MITHFKYTFDKNLIEKIETAFNCDKVDDKNFIGIPTKFLLEKENGNYDLIDAEELLLNHNQYNTIKKLFEEIVYHYCDILNKFDKNELEIAEKNYFNIEIK